MKNKLLAIFLIFLILSCQNGLEVDSTKHTATDPIADITYLKGYFYTTNLDLSTNSGPQIDLYKIDSTSFPVDRFEMDLNGQGYLAATNDGTNLYFQPRFTDYILKMTPLGELFWYQSDYFLDNTADTTSTFMYWSGRGITWADTNLVVLYGHKEDSTLYRWRYIAVENDFSTVKETVVIWEHLNNSGVYVSVDTSYIIGFNGMEVPTSNSISYSNSSGEINNMIAPVRSMVGDTMRLRYTYFNGMDSIFIVLE